MAEPTFFFYDLETSGLSGSDDRIMQFAGQRTNLNLEPIENPVNILVRLEDDTLPSPSAILTTKITPQKTREDGISERELARILHEEIFTPDTIILGFNSNRFDDKFIQHLFWRNFYDPYEWQWKDGRSRWDMLDVVRMTRALRPEGINWPVTDEGKPTNRLELITKENGISHESAHDALSDVNALIDVTRLIRDKQPHLYKYLLKMRDKREVKRLINPDSPEPFVYSSGRYGSNHSFTTVAVPVFSTKNDQIVVFDLRVNLDEKLTDIKKNKPEALKDKDTRYSSLFYPAFKDFAFNRCPAVAPLGVLDKESGWKKVELSKDTIKKNLESLNNHPEIITRIKKEFDEKTYNKPAPDAEGSLYDGFVPDNDKRHFSTIRKKDENSMADYHPIFTDERLGELLLHYKAKNFPTSLTEAEQAKWNKYRTDRLTRQSAPFLAELQKKKEEGADDFILDELYLWYQSLSETDY